MLHIREKDLARLLPVVADIDSAFKLPVDNVAGRSFDRGVERGLINGFVAAQTREHLPEMRGSRQTTRMRDQDAFRRMLHADSPL
jgi:hypothetical protein